MADEELNPKMRYNPFWYQGWEFDDCTIDLSNVKADIDMNGHAIKNLKHPPADPEDAVTKKYVDDAIAAGQTGPITADKVSSVATAQIQAVNVQDAINEISTEAAFLDAANTFQEVNTFLKVPKLDVAAVPKTNQDVATVGLVAAALKTVKAPVIPVEQTPPLNNLTGTNVQDVIEQADNLFDELSDLITDNTALIGTYDAKNNVALEVFGGARAGGITGNAALPAAADENKNMFLLVKVAGRGAAPAPVVDFKEGDIILSDGARWVKIETGLAKTVLAEQVPIKPIQNVQGANVQEALQSLSVRSVNATNVLTNVPNLTGANVQEVLTDASTKIQANKTEVDKLKTGLSSLTAAQVAFDNTQANIAGAVNVQKAIEGVNKKFSTSIQNLNASVIPFQSQQGLTGTNVAAALDELKQAEKTLDTIYVKQLGGVLKGDLNAGGFSVTGLADPSQGAANQAATKGYVDSVGGNFVKKTGGILEGVLNANGNKIISLADPDPAPDTDAANVKYVKDTYVAKSGGELTGPLNVNGQELSGVPDPTKNSHPVNFIYAQRTYLPKTGAVLGGPMDAGGHRITRVGDAVDIGDAINKGMLDAKFDSIQSQLTGKLTFVGTYNANNNTVASISAAIQTPFPEYKVGQALPADDPKFINHFLIVVNAGTGTAPAPTMRLHVGDLIYSTGSAWGHVPLGATSVAKNVGIDPIANLQGVSDVQVALERLATTPPGNADASSTRFTPVGSITATNVQDAIESLDQNKAANDQVVKLTGNQTIQGNKSFDNLRADSGGAPVAFRIVGDKEKAKFIEWIESNGNRYAYIGFGSSGVGNRGIFHFYIGKSLQGDVEKFEFNKAIQFNSQPVIDHKWSVLTREFTEKNFVRLTADQTVEGSKEFRNRTVFYPKDGDVSFSIKRNREERSYFEFLEGKSNARYAYFGFGDKNAGRQGVFQFWNDKVSQNHPAYFEFNRPVRYYGTQPIVHQNDFVYKEYVENNFVQVADVEQTVLGKKTFGPYMRAGKDEQFFKLTPDTDATKTLSFSDSTIGNDNKFNIDLERKSSLKNLVDPVDDFDAVTKKYVDDKVAAGGGGGVTGPAGVDIVSVADLDVTKSIATLTGKGTLKLSYNMLTANKGTSVLSALFGMKLELTAPWTPGTGNVPMILPEAAHIPGDSYYKGLPIPPDATLGGNYKTVAQLMATRVVPTGGINMPQVDKPIHIGRLVCLNKAGADAKTQLFIVFNYAGALPIPAGTGAFYVMRYEGLPSIVI